MSTANLDSADLKAGLGGSQIREEVMNKIFDLSRIPLPFTDMVGSGTCKNEYTEWLEDDLGDPDVTNAVVDGSDASGNDTVIGTRQGNHHQISDKTVRVSYRADASDTIARANELAHQIKRRQQNLRRDVEAIVLFNQASVADNGDTVAGKAGGLPSWLETSSYGGVGHAAGGFDTGTGLTVGRTVGTAAALSVQTVKDAVESVYNEGGESSVFMSVPGVVSKFTDFLFTSDARIATLQADQGKSSGAITANGAINTYITDFGKLDIIANRIQQPYGTTTADAFILDPSYLELCYLKGYRADPLAKTGLAENRQLSVDWTLIVKTEAAQAMIGDVDYSLDAIA